MTYFTQDDHMALLSSEANRQGGEAGLQGVYSRMQELHRALYPRLRKNGIDLHTHAPTFQEVSTDTSACTFNAEVMTLTYMRSRSQAQVVENIMGRDATNSSGNIEPHRHPVIEVRICPDGFVVELVVSPDAWYDQQNVVGKMTVQEQRTQLYKLLRNLKGDYRVGFWNGTSLDEMHVNTEQLPPAHVMHQWLETFAAGRDWFRVGVWYGTDSPELNKENIVNTIFNHIRDLYAIYEYVSWNSNNNFHKFYKQAVARVR